MAEADLAEVFARALAGDQAAWNVLVRAVGTGMAGLVRGYPLRGQDASDVCQGTWLTLLERPSAVREPSRLPGWLCTTARRSALRSLTRTRREVDWSWVPPGREPAPPPPEARLLQAERDHRLWAAIGRLPARYQRLIWLTAYHPELTYAQLGVELGIQPSSVGPFRRRCLDRLRRELLADGFDPTDVP